MTQLIVHHTWTCFEHCAREKWLSPVSQLQRPWLFFKFSVFCSIFPSTTLIFRIQLKKGHVFPQSFLDLILCFISTGKIIITWQLLPVLTINCVKTASILWFPLYDCLNVEIQSASHMASWSVTLSCFLIGLKYNMTFYSNFVEILV